MLNAIVQFSAHATPKEKPSILISKKLIQAMNSGQYDAMQQFARQHIARDTLKRFGLEMYSNYLAAEAHFHGEFELISSEINSYENGLINSYHEVISKNTLMQYRMELSITDTLPHKLTRIRLRAQEQKSLFDNQQSDAIRIKKLSQYIDFVGEKGVFSGVVLLAKDDTVIFQKAIGMASKRFNVKNTLDTRFNLGSMNKMFTSVAILRMVEAGKLNLTTKLVDIFNLDTSNLELKAIEIQHLLSHTSGIAQLQCDKGEVFTVKDKTSCLAQLAKIKTHFKSGSQYRYSNDGMFVLGMVLEQLTGKPYDQVIKQQVFDIAGMEQSENLDMQFPVSDAALGYAYNGKHNRWRNNLFIHEQKGGPAGGGYSTAIDLLKFSLALKNNQLLSEPMTQLAITPKVAFGATNYGFGFIDWQRDNKPVIGHNGTFVGVSSQLEMHLASDLTVIVLSNHSFGADPILAQVHSLFGI